MAEPGPTPSGSVARRLRPPRGPGGLYVCRYLARLRIAAQLAERADARSIPTAFREPSGPCALPWLRASDTPATPDTRGDSGWLPPRPAARPARGRTGRLPPGPAGWLLPGPAGRPAPGPAGRPAPGPAGWLLPGPAGRPAPGPAAQLLPGPAGRLLRVPAARRPPGLAGRRPGRGQS